MRKHIKKQLIELIFTVKEGIEYVSALNNKEQAENILIDCYSAVSHIKQVIESAVKKEKHLKYTKCIEDIQNNMEMFNDCIQNEIDYTEILNSLKSYFNIFTDALINEQEKTEVVFLPYKASMWDSLESVWEAAEADENCDAYVIPIPYYDRNSDGTLSEMHYEGALYPDYVPITHYNDYNFETRKPDVIFIHNPYDDNNLVTTVHPYFYSKNLKKITDKLIYVPYFVLAEPDPNDEKAIEKLSHFITCPGVINANLVIVQSEAMRQVYVKVLYDLGKANGIQKEYWEKKILGFGSPKIDKVIKMKKGDVEIPKDWQKIIKKSDGSLKKIVFYNTGLSALLEHSEKMLEKIKSVLKIFKEKKEDIALLWRPHPLMKATIGSMRPKLWEEYEKIVNSYIDEKWGIYDDTPNNDRAIVLSDAYYGDASSMVTLYKETGKPIMIQDVEII